MVAIGGNVMTNVIDSLKKEQEELKEKLEQITAAIACLTSVAQVGNALSADVRKRMSVGMKRYWAEKKARTKTIGKKTK